MVKLMGGLGNQLFQYACGRALAHRVGAVLKLDISWFHFQHKRRYSLDQFSIAAMVADADEIAAVLSGRRGVLGRVDAGLQRLKPYYKRRLVRERTLSFDPNIARVSPPAYLVGYWGSARYFSDIADRLRAELTLAEPMVQADEARARQIRSCNSVSVHVRRGDYLAARQQALFGLLPQDYYQQAVDYLAQRLEAPRFYFFSDDIAWCRESIRIDHAHEFVSTTARNADGVDLTLLSLCRHHIVANSTFSWWGAWLSCNETKIVIAPRQWYKDPRYSTQDLVPADWIRL